MIKILQYQTGEIWNESTDGKETLGKVITYLILVSNAPTALAYFFFLKPAYFFSTGNAKGTALNQKYASQNIKYDKYQVWPGACFGGST